MATANELRQMTNEELSRMLGDVRQGRFNMKIKHRTGHLENTSELAKSRREIARLETLLHEGKLGLQRNIGAKAAPGELKQDALTKKTGSPKGGARSGRSVKVKRSVKA